MCNSSSYCRLFGELLFLVFYVLTISLCNHSASVLLWKRLNVARLRPSLSRMQPSAIMNCTFETGACVGEPRLPFALSDVLALTVCFHPSPLHLVIILSPKPKPRGKMTHLSPSFTGTLPVLLRFQINAPWSERKKTDWWYVCPPPTPPPFPTFRGVFKFDFADRFKVAPPHRAPSALLWFLPDVVLLLLAWWRKTRIFQHLKSKNKSLFHFMSPFEVKTYCQCLGPQSCYVL